MPPSSELCHDSASLLTQLIYLSTPAGASVITPLTTLLETTPLLTSASLAAALGFDATVNLLTYDSLYQAFVMLDPRALSVIQAEQQVRTLCCWRGCRVPGFPFGHKRARSRGRQEEFEAGQRGACASSEHVSGVHQSCLLPCVHGKNILKNDFVFFRPPLPCSSDHNPHVALCQLCCA